MRHGQGLYEWSDGTSYEGDFDQGKINGYGVYKQIDGTVYKG